MDERIEAAIQNLKTAMLALDTGEQELSRRRAAMKEQTDRKLLSHDRKKQNKLRESFSQQVKTVSNLMTKRNKASRELVELIEELALTD